MVRGSVVGALLVLVASVAAWPIVSGLFRPPVVYRTAAHPLDVFVADIDGDGHLDVLTANRDGRSVSIFAGNGDGTLEPDRRIDTGLGATSLAVDDMNLDGIADIVVSACTEECTDNSILIYSGTGGGAFRLESTLAVSGVPYDVGTADFDLDGLPDIAASDNPGRRLIVLLSNWSAGSFTETALATGENPVALSIGDLNLDGVPDLVSSDHGSGSSSVYLALGNGEFSERIEVETGSLPYAIALGSIDADAIPDLLVAHSTEPGRITVFKGSGDGTFAIHDEFEVRDRPVHVESADFDADGVDDLVVTHDRDRSAGVFLNEGDGLFGRSEIEVPAENRVFSLAVADLDRDGTPDFVTVDYERSTVSVSLGLPRPAFFEPTR